MRHSFTQLSSTLSPLQPDMARVHELLWQLGDADGAFLQDLVRTLLDRPRDAHRAVAALLLARAVQAEVPDTIIQFAAAVQIVYAASLAHRTLVAGTAAPDLDDRLVVLAGDYLYAQAAARTANLKDLQVMARLAESIKAICREGTQVAATPRATSQEDGLFRLSLWGTAALLRLAPDLQTAVALVGQALDSAAAGHDPDGDAVRAATGRLEALPAFAALAGAQSFVPDLLALIASQDDLAGQRQSS